MLHSLRSFVMVLSFLITGFCSIPLFAEAIDVHDFTQLEQGAEKEMRYRRFIDELRCPKCQNQNLSGSNSPIAQDLRRELFRMVIAEQSDDEIKGFMVKRYGNFVLYEPPVDKNTLILWSAPVVMLCMGVCFALWFKRHQRLQDAEKLSPSELKALEQVLHKYG